MGSFAFAICLIGEILVLCLSRSSFFVFLTAICVFPQIHFSLQPPILALHADVFLPCLLALRFVWCTCEFDLELSCSCSAFLTSYFVQNHWRCLSWSHSKHLHTFIFSNASLGRSKITVSSTFFFFLSPESKLFLVTFPEVLVSLCPGRCLGWWNLPPTVVNLSRPLSQPYHTSSTGF